MMDVRFTTSLAAVCLAGCAIQPTPEDVTGLTPYHITRQIRCESRQALRDALVRWLTRASDAKMQRIGEDLRDDETALARFGPASFASPDLAAPKAIAALFMNTGVAWDFTLDMSEQNDVSAGASFTRALLNPVIDLGISGKLDRKRENSITYTTTDTFSSLMKLPPSYCEHFVATENHVYPIGGRIGMDKAVADFVEMTLFTGLKKDKNAGPPTMTRTLKFTTTINAGVNPTVTYTPLDSAFQLKSLTGSFDVDRTDIHQVIVTLALGTPEAAAIESLRSAIFAEGARRLVVNRATGDATLSPLVAISAGDRVKNGTVRLVTGP